MGIFGKIKPVRKIGLSTDIHCHAMPGIDDGAENMGDAVTVLKAMSDAGITKIFLSPHYDALRTDMRQIIEAGLSGLRNRAAEENIDIELEAHAEYYINSDFDALLKSGEKLLCLPQGYILVEASLYQENMVLQQTIFDLQEAGYKPILAHPERYTYYNMEALTRLKHSGCCFQVNLLSLVGNYGNAVKHRAETMLKGGMADFLGSDIHRPSQTAVLSHPDLLRIIEKITVKNNIFD